MSSQTAQYGLIKPTKAIDFVDVDQLNSNMDIIDLKIKNLNEQLDYYRNWGGRIITQVAETAAITSNDYYSGFSSQIPTNGKHIFKLHAKWDAFSVNETAGAGHAFSFQRSDNGNTGSYVSIPSNNFFNCPYPGGSAVPNSYSFTWYDQPNISGYVQYRMYWYGIVAFGSTIGNRFLNIYDAGMLPGGTEWNQVPATATWANLDPAFTWNNFG